MSVLRLDGVRVRGASADRLLVPELEVREREILVVLGPTGAGKSTLLQVMHFLLRPEEGTLAWHGREVRFPAPLETRRRIVMAFQDPHLFSGTVAENVAYGLEVRGLRGDEVRRRVAEALEVFRGGSLASRRATTLSGGEARRVALARALVVEPELLLLDEPLASLDEPIREALLEELVRILRARGITCVLVTHDQTEALAVADRVAVLDRGRVVQTGAPEEIYYRPRNRFVAEFVRTGNVLPGRVVAGTGGLVTVEVGEVRFEAVSSLAEGSRVLLCLRPEEIVVAAAGETASTSARNRLSGKVLHVVAQGPVVVVTVACGCTLKALVTRPSAVGLGLVPGVEVSLSFKATAVHLLPDAEA